jgi:hypothetical protein
LHPNKFLRKGFIKRSGGKKLMFYLAVEHAEANKVRYSPEFDH